MNRRRRRRAKKKGGLIPFILFLLCLAITTMLFIKLSPDKKHRDELSGIPSTEAPTASTTEPSTAPEAIELPSLSYEEKLRIIEASAAYPQELAELARKCPQTIDFVFDYPEKKDVVPTFSLAGEISDHSVPLLIQWDERWGYMPYGNGLIGSAGCGPTALSMVAIHLTGDVTCTPNRVAKFAYENGYYVPGNGSAWTLISQGSAALGVSAKTLILWEPTMKWELDNGHPIIIVVGPGDFTSSGHFLVITGYTEDGFTVNDPNSYENSNKVWPYDTLAPQIRNLWAMSKAE